MAILAGIFKFAGAALGAWFMKPIYQAIIVILVIVIIWMYMKNQKAKS